MREVICINNNWLEPFTFDGSDPNITQFPKKGEILEVFDWCKAPDNVLYFCFEKYNENEKYNWYDARCFADISNLESEINSALKAPNPDYRIEKLSPSEKSYDDCNEER